MELGEGEDDGDDMICMPLSFASMQSYHSPEALLADSAPEFDDDLSAEDFVRQVEKKIDEAGLDLNLSLDAWDDDNMTFQNPLEVVEEYDIEKYADLEPNHMLALQHIEKAGLEARGEPPSEPVVFVAPRRDLWERRDSHLGDLRRVESQSGVLWTCVKDAEASSFSLHLIHVTDTHTY